MTKAELIAALEPFDDDATVVFLYPAGDYWKSFKAPTVKKVEEVEITWSSYFDENILSDDAGDETATVIGLS